MKLGKASVSKNIPIEPDGEMSLFKCYGPAIVSSVMSLGGTKPYHMEESCSRAGEARRWTFENIVCFQSYVSVRVLSLLSYLFDRQYWLL
jgi:hypothetical protein